MRVRSSRLTRSSLDSGPCVYAEEPRPAKKNGRRIRKLRFFALVVVLGLLSSASFVFGLMTAIASQLPDYNPAHQQKIAHDGYMYDRNGELLTVLRGRESRVLLTSNQINPIMKQAIVAIEDKRFFDHRGVDMRAIGRALWADIQNQGVVQGGSTITQQFIKNAYVKDNRSVARKLKEAALAWQLEQREDKDWILTAYLNTIYFGNGAYGIEQAALTYFHKHASKLTLPEAALLAGIPRDPARYDPVTNPKDAKERRRARARLDARAGSHRSRRVPARAKRSPALAGRGAAARDPGEGGPVLRQLREGAAHQPRGLRPRGRLRRWAPGQDDARPRPPEEGARSNRQGAHGPRGTAGGARRDRSEDRRGARDGRRLELPGEPVQPRGPGRAAAGVGLQAVRPRRCARARGSPRRPSSIRAKS